MNTISLSEYQKIVIRVALMTKPVLRISFCNLIPDKALFIWHSPYGFINSSPIPKPAESLYILFTKHFGRVSLNKGKNNEKPFKTSLPLPCSVIDFIKFAARIHGRA